jgi:UDP-4-amino-4,6-dideoxy-N-acetyl-beta-L-altrosamine transaminase
MATIPYSCQSIDESDIDAVVAVLRSEFLTQGPAVPAFEEAFAREHRVEHAVAVCNATAALHIGCLALGVGPGKRVWTSPNSFLASANCALYCGATVDFVDIDPSTRNISIGELREKLDAAARNNALPDVVIPVDFAGLPCDLREMRELADRFGFRILQDASHAVGASYLGRPVGSAYADVSVFSFHAVKVITTAEGGMLTTQDPALARTLRLLRSHGMTRDKADLQRRAEGSWVYEQQALGFNCRLTDLQAALGLSQLKRLPELRRARIERAERYDSLLQDLPLRLPPRLADRECAWHLYSIEIGPGSRRSRAEVFERMREEGIGVNVHYIPIHTQPYYQSLGFRPGDFPSAEHYYAGAVSIPLFPKMTDEQQRRVADVLRAALVA